MDRRVIQIYQNGIILKALPGRDDPHGFFDAGKESVAVD